MAQPTSTSDTGETQRNGTAPDMAGFDTVIVATPDLAGRLVGKRLSARHFRESGEVRMCDVVFGWGIGHELLDGFASVGWEHGYGDVISQPDPAAVRPLAWWPKTALVMADAVRPDGTPLAVSPRTVLRRQVERARELGYVPLIASELEFMVYAETPESLLEKRFAALSLHREELAPELVETTGLDEELFAELRSAMESSGVPVESIKAEYSPSQFEMTLEPADAVELADRHAVYKMGVRELCRRRGLAATFMAKPDSDLGGQSCHLHISLAHDEGDNAFAEGSDSLMRRFVGGLQRYAADVFLLWAPYPNSYKRFRPGTFAPASISWGEDNRTAAVRICGEGRGRHVENRIPGADVNPYLAHAALLAAGLRGIADGVDADEGVGHANAYASTDVSPLPASLDEAIAVFRASEFSRESFGREVVEHIARFAGAELDASRLAVTDFDRRRLFDI